MSKQVKHVVLFKKRPEVSEQAFVALMEEINSLKPTHPGILAFDYGPNKTPEDRDHGYNYGFTLTLASWNALALYQADPVHQATGRKLIQACEPDHSGILAFDYEVDRS